MNRVVNRVVNLVFLWLVQNENSWLLHYTPPPPMRQAVPQPHVRWIERPRLWRMFDDWHERRLIRVTAPAGFGKTTLAATWLQQLSPGPFVAWLSLDVEDDARDVLLRHIVESLLPALPDLAQAFTLESAGRLTLAQALRLLCGAVAEAQREFILVLDDCHLLRAAETLAVLQHLLDAAPANLHLLLLARETQPLNVARMRLHGQLLDITAADLSLDHEEFGAFVRGSALAELSPQRLADIERRAEGWIAGLQMLSSTRNAREAVPDEAWQANVVAEFMEQEVFCVMDPAVRAFLIDTALLPWLSAGPAAVVTGLDEAQCTRLLYAAADANAFVTPVAAPIKAKAEFTCRCHPLLREFLLRKLQDERSPAQLRALRLRTAAWLGAHGEVDAALTLLAPIAAWDEAAAIVAAASRPAILRMDLASLQRWLARLPADVVARTPQLAVDAAWRVLLSDGADLQAPVDQALAVVSEDNAELRVELGTLQVFCDLTRGDLPAARAAIARTEEILPGSVGLGAGYLNLVRSYEPVDPNDFEQRIQLLVRGEQIFHAIGFDYGCVEAVTARGLVKRLYVDLHGALAGLRYAASVIRRSGWQHSLYSFDCHLACGEILYEMNEIAAARQELQTAIQANLYSDSKLATTQLARLMLELCDAAESGSGFAPANDDDVWAGIVAEINPLIAAHVGWFRIRRDLRAGRLERCWQTVETLHVLPADLRPEMPGLLWMAVLSGALTNQRQVPLLGPLLSDCRGRLEKACNLWLALRVRVMQVVHALSIDDVAAAEVELESLLPEIERSSMLRTVLDWPQLESLLARNRSPFAQRLRGMFGPAAPTALPFGLSEHEFQVLRAIAAHLSTAEIAHKMFVEKSTVRKHLIHIFRKMGVHSRDEAVHAARKAGFFH